LIETINRSWLEISQRHILFSSDTEGETRTIARLEDHEKNASESPIKIGGPEMCCGPYNERRKKVLNENGTNSSSIIKQNCMNKLGLLIITKGKFYGNTLWLKK